MARSRAVDRNNSHRASARDRHGRGLRSPVTGPRLPLLHTRVNIFDLTVGSAAQYLKELWPAELDTVSFEVAGVPEHLSGSASEASSGSGTSSGSGSLGVDRWRVFRTERRIVLYRLPIERLSKLHRYDELHRRMMIESCVFRAVAELIGKDPWELAPDRYRHH